MSALNLLDADSDLINSELSEGWNFEHSYAKLPKIFYRKQNPEKFPNSQMVIFNHNLSCDLGLNSERLKNASEIFTGTQLPVGAKPIAQAYGGYQFGHFSILGDGRAVLLGEHIAPNSHRFDIQLKGSGPTPFSRRGDGYAALLPMLREYIISEAMYYLGIPTTRSLAVALTGKDVFRENILQGAVLTRIASSHIRVGTFNYISAIGTNDDSQSLADYCIWRHFPWLDNFKKDPSNKDQNKYILFFREVAKLQASLIASWQLIGFIHGVMNTDNMAISGETIDYGPCAFMDVYDPDTVFSSIDTSGRYAYKNQPIIGAWNLSRFAESLLFLFSENENKAIELAKNEIEYYWECYEKNWLSGMQAKLGIINEKPEDAGLIVELLELMTKHNLDYTNTFRDLSTLLSDSQHRNTVSDIPEFVNWIEKWQESLGLHSQNKQYLLDVMNKHNPAIIPRNHHVESALSAADQGDFSLIFKLLSALRNPYERSKETEEYSQPPVTSSCGYKTFCGT